MAICFGTALQKFAYKLTSEQVLTLDYLINAHCAFIYFNRKILPCAILIYISDQYYDSPVRLLIFGKIPCPVGLLHTVQLLDSP